MTDVIWIVHSPLTEDQLVVELQATWPCRDGRIGCVRYHFVRELLDRYGWPHVAVVVQSMTDTIVQYRSGATAL
jgi:hypothetical protein